MNSGRVSSTNLRALSVRSSAPLRRSLARCLAVRQTPCSAIGSSFKCRMTRTTSSRSSPQRFGTQATTKACKRSYAALSSIPALLTAISPTPRLWKRPRLRSCPRRFASSTQSKLLKIASRLRSKTRSMALTCTPLSTALRPAESMRSISTLTIVFSPIRTPCVNVTARTFATALCRSGSTASNGTTRPKKSQRACAP